MIKHIHVQSMKEMEAHLNNELWTTLLKTHSDNIWSHGFNFPLRKDTYIDDEMIYEIAKQNVTGLQNAFTFCLYPRQVGVLVLCYTENKTAGLEEHKRESVNVDLAHSSEYPNVNATLEANISLADGLQQNVDCSDLMPFPQSQSELKEDENDPGDIQETTISKDLSRKTNKRPQKVENKRKTPEKMSIFANQESTTESVKKYFNFPTTISSSITISPKKMAAFFVLMLCLSGIHSAETAIATHRNNEHINYTYRILMTAQCSDREIMRRSKCSSDDYYRNVYIDFCGFSQLCAKGTRPMCIDTLIGMTHICSPENKTCRKGYTTEVWIDESDQLHLHEKDVMCPLGTYQPTESSCYDGCQYTHRDFATLGNQLVVYSYGDHVYPTYVYCNYRAGFYNPEGKFLHDFDADGSNVCLHISEGNPCVRHQTPLPNGTCVNPCAKGSCRDDHDGFHCKMKNIETDCNDSVIGLETLVKNEIDDDYRPSQKATGLIPEVKEDAKAVLALSVNTKATIDYNNGGPVQSLGNYKITVTVLAALTIAICVLALVIFI